MNKPVILVKDVSKSYKKICAVDSINFNVMQSECFGFLGPNGAGKTTLMKMLFGKATRDFNRNSLVDVFGFDPQKSSLEIKYISGIVPQEDNLDSELSVIQNLMVFSKFYGLNTNDAKKRIYELLEFMELSGKINSKIRELSGGMKRRLVIARALLNNPKILILDEPTTGLDPQVRHMIWDKLRILMRNGVTILLTTHYMEEAFQLCTRIIIMNKGKKIIEGNPQRLIEENIEKYVLEIYDECKISDLDSEKNIRLDKTENRVLVFSNHLGHIENIGKKHNFCNFYIRGSNLEDLFLKITGRSLNE